MGLHKGQTNNKKGKPVGTISQKTLNWEVMGERVTGKFTDNSIRYLDRLWLEDEEKAFEEYLKLLEYFKPKQQRTDFTTNGKDITPAFMVTVETTDQKQQLDDFLNRKE